MLLLALLLLYGLAVAAWALASLVIVLYLLKYHFTSLVAWFILVLYGGIASQIFFATWRAFTGLGIQLPLLFL